MNRKSTGQHLHHLIGARARYNDALYEVLEILDDDPPSLVLQNPFHTTIQPDQHGEAHRRVPQTVTVPLQLTDDGRIDFDEMDLKLLDPERPSTTLVS